MEQHQSCDGGAGETCHNPRVLDNSSRQHHPPQRYPEDAALVAQQNAEFQRDYQEIVTNQKVAQIGSGSSLLRASLLGRALRGNTSISKLRLDGSGLTMESVDDYTEFLATNPCLEVVYFMNFASDEHSSRIFQQLLVRGIARNERAKCMRLSFLRVSLHHHEDEMYDTQPGKQDHHERCNDYTLVDTASEFVFTECSLYAVYFVMKGLRNNHGVKSVSISSIRQIRQDDPSSHDGLIDILSSMSRSCKTIKSMILNDFSAKDKQTLAQAAAKSKTSKEMTWTLTHQLLRYNFLRDDTSLIHDNQLMDTQHLKQKASISFNWGRGNMTILMNVVRSILEGLRQNECVASIHLNPRYLNDEGLQQTQRVLRENPLINSFGFTTNLVPKSTLSRIGEIIRTTSLEYFKTDGSLIDIDAVESILRSCRDTSTVKTLEFWVDELYNINRRTNLPQVTDRIIRYLPQLKSVRRLKLIWPRKGTGVEPEKYNELVRDFLRALELSPHLLYFGFRRDSIPPEDKKFMLAVYRNRVRSILESNQVVPVALIPTILTNGPTDKRFLTLRQLSGCLTAPGRPNKRNGPTQRISNKHCHKCTLDD